MGERERRDQEGERKQKVVCQLTAGCSVFAQSVHEAVVGVAGEVVPIGGHGEDVVERMGGPASNALDDQENIAKAV